MSNIHGKGAIVYLGSVTGQAAATAMLDERAKGPPLPSVISRTIVQTLQILRPLGIPVMASAPPPSPAE